MDKNLIDIKVLGTSFTIQVDENKEYMNQVLQYLENIINKVENTAGIKDPLKIAILTSINLIDELYKERAGEKMQETDKFFTEFTERVISCIDDALEN